MKAKIGKSINGNDLKRTSIISMIYSFLVLDFRGMGKKKHLIPWIIILALMLFFVNKSITRHKEMPEKNQKFNQIQKNYFKSLRNYNDYKDLGIYFLFNPSSCGILFENTTVPTDVTAKVDSIVTVKIDNNLKGKSVHAGISIGKIDFSHIILWLVSFMALWHGCESLHTREYLLSLTSKWSTFEIYLAVGAARFIVFAAHFFVILGCILLFITARGVEFTANEYTALSGHLLATLIMLLFFFFIGRIIGTIPSPLVSSFCILGSVILLTVILPGLTGSVAEDHFPDMIEDFQTDLDKFKIVSGFENRSIEEEGQFDRDKMETEHRIIEEYWNHYFKKVKEREERFIADMRRAVDRANRLAVLTPTTFYLLTGNEVSSKGYAGYLEFLDFVKFMWVKFTRFWIDRVFYHDPDVLVNFIEGDENIFRSRARLPKYFVTGLLINLDYIIILFFISYLRFKRWLHPKTKKPGAFAGISLAFTAGNTYTITPGKRDFINQFLNWIFGRGSGLTWSLTIDGKSISVKGKWDFFYIPPLDQIPGELKVWDLIMLFKRLLKLPGTVVKEAFKSIDMNVLNSRFRDLENFDKAVVLLRIALLTNSKVFIFNDFASGIPGYRRKELADYLSKNGSRDLLIIDIVSRDCYWLESDRLLTVAYQDNRYRIQ